MASKFTALARTFRFIGYIVVVSVPLLVEHAGEIPEKDAHPPPLYRLSNLVLHAPIGYDAVTRLGFRHAMPHLVQIVRVRDQQIMSLPVCQKRLFLAKLVKAVEEIHPSLIALDIWFPQNACPSNDPGTDALLESIQGSSVPIVVSMETYPPSEFAKIANDQTANKGDDRPVVSEAQFEQTRTGRLVLGRDLTFRSESHKNGPGNVMLVNVGLVRIAADIKKIPLTWPVYEVQPNGDLGDVRVMPSLSLVAAETYEREISNGRVSSRLRDLVDAEAFPYITSLSPEKSAGAPNGIPVTDALKLVCGSLPAADWTRCGAENRSALVSVAPIVMISQWTSSDVHGDPPMPGDVLQANYMEALLEESYIAPVPERSTLVLNICWILLVEVIFFIWPTPRAVKYAVFATLAILGITYFILLEWGYFLVFWTLALAVISPMVRYFEELKHVLVHG